MLSSKLLCRRAGLVILFGAVLASCGGDAERPAPAPADADEERALEQASAMLDERRDDDSAASAEDRGIDGEAD